MKKIKILITSIGSLVGQNLLDALEYSEFNRRHLVEVIGTNSLVESSNNFRCDKCYLVSNTSTKEFCLKISQIIKNENPDLILTARDEDSSILSDVLRNLDDANCVLPYGSKNAQLICLDKFNTWKFTQKYDLPFADTFVINKSGDLDALKQFVIKVGFPVIAKPIKGFASKGVFFLRDIIEVEKIANDEGYMFQEYLGDPELLTDYFNAMDGPIPLFAHAPNVFHHTCQTVISPDGVISPFSICKNLHDSGKTIGAIKVENKELERQAIRYAKAFISEGGSGPFGAQFRQNKEGIWKVQEINARTNGNTYARLLFGQDDIGLIIQKFLPDKEFPVLLESLGNDHDLVSKILYATRIQIADINRLKNMKYWEK